MLSAAQNVTSVLRGAAEHNRSASDGAAFFNGFVGDENVNGNGHDHDSVEDKLKDVKIEPVRPAVAAIGKGELSLESLGLVPDDSVPTSNGLSPTGPNAHLSTHALGPTSMGRAKSSTSAYLDNSQSGMGSGPGGANSRSRSVHSFSRRKRFKRRTASEDWAALEPSSSMAQSTTINNSDGDENNNTTTTTVSATATSMAGDASNSNNGAGDRNSGDSAGPLNSKSEHLAGFAYASRKRNQEFHKLFRSLPQSDLLLDDFSCALSRDILIQGRMYVSERNICFNSNILGWVTNLVVSFDEIVGLEKKNTAGFIPNGIVVQSLHARHSFASFISRDTVFEFLMSIWRHTNTRLDTKARQPSAQQSFEDASTTETDDTDDSDESGDSSDGVTIASDDGSDDSSDFDDDDDEDNIADISGANVKDNGGSGANSNGAGDSSSPSADGTAGSWPVPNPGPETHAPTDPGFDYQAAGEKLLINDIINAPLGVVANLLFGDDTKWMANFITEKEKNIELKNLSGFDGGMAPGHKRNYEYVKPLNGAVGPKQTRCIITDTLETVDFESSVGMVTSTSTPDVPSGSNFKTKTRYTLSWAENNTTRLLLTYLIDWTKSSWLKGPIEKGTHDGQTTMARNLINELNKAVRRGGSRGHSNAGGVSKPSGGKKKKSKKRKKEKDAVAVSNMNSGLLSQVIDVMTTQPIDMVPVPLWAFILIFIIFFWWILGHLWGSDRGSKHGVDFLRRYSRDKLEMKRMEEEYNIWRWIEDRGASQRQFMNFDRAKYFDQELQEAIRLTEMRIQELKKGIELNSPQK